MTMPEPVYVASPKRIAPLYARRMWEQRHPAAERLKSSKAPNPFGSRYVPNNQRPAEMGRAWKIDAGKFFEGVVADHELTWASTSTVSP